MIFKAGHAFWLWLISKPVNMKTYLKIIGQRIKPFHVLLAVYLMIVLGGLIFRVLVR